MIDLFFGDTSAYKSEVITLFKLSSKSATMTESKFTFPIVYLFLSFSSCFSLSIRSEFSTLFISSLKMLIVPVVFFSIVCGVANLGDVASLGRIGGKAIFLYLFSTSIAITLALIFANIIDPGSNTSLSLNVDYQAQSAPAIGNILESLIPSNPLKALTEGNMLQIICFAIILGITLTRLKGNNLNKIKCKLFKCFS